MSVYENLKKLNLEIPKAPDPVGAYIAYKKTANLLFISGQISIDSNGKITKGKLEKDLTIEQGQTAAKLCAINIIAQAKKACNERLENIANCIKLTGYVNSTNEFTDQPKIINAASELIFA
ncbi:MAG: RidA family protein, partial [Pelagibacteraceae bacterium]|nr:RidA family protein [Pelagibacteraceae bacterium]